MEQESAQSVLARLLRSAGQAAANSAVTPTRALRLAMARAAEQSVGLNLSVLGVTEEVMPLDEALESLAPEMMLLALGRGGDPVGLAAFDLQLRTATVEVQTVGALRPAPAAERRITDADAALCAPLVTGFLADLAQTALDTSLEGWADGVDAGVRLPDARAAGMILEDCVMRLVRLSLELGGSERQGELLVALASGPKAHPAKMSRKPPHFTEALRASVMRAPAELHAVLHRLPMSLRDVEGFKVGQVLPLTGVTVGSVRLEGPDGGCVGQARLGQVTGLRAVRIEQTARIEMRDAALGQHLSDAVAMADDLGAGLSMLGEGGALPGPLQSGEPEMMPEMAGGADFGSAMDGGEDAQDFMAEAGFDAAPLGDLGMEDPGPAEAGETPGLGDFPPIGDFPDLSDAAEDGGDTFGFDATPMTEPDPQEAETS